MPVVDLDMPIRDYVAAFRSRPKTPADDAERRDAEAIGKMCWPAEDWLKTKPDRWTYRDALLAIPQEGKPLRWVLTSMKFTDADLTPRTAHFCRQVIIDNTTIGMAGPAFALYRDGNLPRDQKAQLLDKLAPRDSKTPRHERTERLKRQRGEDSIPPVRARNG